MVGVPPPLWFCGPVVREGWEPRGKPKGWGRLVDRQSALERAPDRPRESTERARAPREHVKVKQNNADDLTYYKKHLFDQPTR